MCLLNAVPDVGQGGDHLPKEWLYGLQQLPGVDGMEGYEFLVRVHPRLPDRSLYLLSTCFKIRTRSTVHNHSFLPI